MLSYITAKLKAKVAQLRINPNIEAQNSKQVQMSEIPNRERFEI